MTNAFGCCFSFSVRFPLALARPNHNHNLQARNPRRYWIRPLERSRARRRTETRNCPKMRQNRVETGGGAQERHRSDRRVHRCVARPCGFLSVVCSSLWITLAQRGDRFNGRRDSFGYELAGGDAGAPRRSFVPVAWIHSAQYAALLCLTVAVRRLRLHPVAARCTPTRE